MSQSKRDQEHPAFAIFRGRDGVPYAEGGPMYIEGESPAAAAGFPKLYEAGYGEGNSVRLLFSAPGMSLTHVWFKSGFPLPRHSHNADCVYYVVAGSLKIGTEELGPGDGFFIGADAPYTYVPGEHGVEVLEFRTADRFDIRMLAENPAFWTRAVEQVLSRREAWATEEPPTAPLPRGA